MSRASRPWQSLAALTIALAISGCGGKPEADGTLVAIRQRLLVAEEPANPRTLSELMAQLAPASTGGDDQESPASTGDGVAGETPVADLPAAAPVADLPAAAPVAEVPAAAAPLAAGDEVWVVGRIFAGDFEPWENGQASFLISELPEQGHGAEHDADNCPFCKRKAAQAPKAMVRFSDEAGSTLAIDARKLFDLKTQDVVVVRGTATMAELNTLIIDATSLHVRR